MIDSDQGDAPLGVIASPLICLGFNSYCCNVVLIDTPIFCLASWNLRLGIVDNFLFSKPHVGLLETGLA
jgi:hypothetical protein